MAIVQLAPGPTAHSAPSLTLNPRSVTARPVPHYEYLGCYEDSDKRVFKGISTQLERNHPDLCCEWCLNQDPTYTMCGLENGHDCWCDATTSSRPSKRPSSACNSPCPGNDEYACGGLWALGIYSATDPVKPTRSTKRLSAQAVSGYSYLGCYSDSPDRVLTVDTGAQKYNDPQYCCELCINLDPGYRWCGVQNEDGCHCGKTTVNANRAPEKECSKSCPGASNNQCGGVWRMNIYNATPAVNALATTSDKESSATSTSSTRVTGESTLTESTSLTSSTAQGDPTSEVRQDSQPRTLGPGPIAGIAIGVVILVLLVAAAAWFFYRHLSRKKDIGSLSSQNRMEEETWRAPRAVVESPPVYEADSTKVAEMAESRTVISAELSG